MADEWQPVVGGRCVYLGNDAVVVEYRSGYATAKVECAGPRIPVDVADLTEHPDDARHRRLLEAAREVERAALAWSNIDADRCAADRARGEHFDAVRTLRAIVAEIDAGEG